MKNEQSSKTDISANFRPKFGGGHRNFGAEKAKNSSATLKRLWKYLLLMKWQLLLVFIMIIMASGAVVAGPYLIGIAIDKYIIPKDYTGLSTLLLIMIIVYFSRSFFFWAQNYVMIAIAQNTVEEMRNDVFKKLQSLPISYFDQHSRGDIMSRVTNDVENVSNILNSSVTQLFSSVISVTGTIAMMIVLSPLLTFFAVLVLPLMFISTRMIAKKTKKYFSQQQFRLGKLNGIIEETITGQRAVKVFTHENSVISTFSTENKLLLKAGLKAQIFSGMIPPFMGVINNLSFAIVAGAGAWMAVANMITIGIIASFIGYTRQFMQPLNEIANQFNLIQSAIAGAERVFQILDEQPEPLDIENAFSLKKIHGKVKFNNVSFGYTKNTDVLKNISFTAEPGQSVALVGPTGAGKTTVVNLMTRFYDITQGSIYIDDIDIKRIKRENLRTSMAIVLQDTHLFSESVRDNIRYGRLNASDEEVEAAARIANAHHFIMNLHNGYETVLSEDGGNISEGQRQLLSISRAILADPPILILDEATSSVDTRTEMKIQEAMLKLMKDRTSIVIAHRLSTIRNSDLILVIDHGEIIERGNHKELMKQKGFYFNLYKTSFVTKN
ncbi:MAG: ABC transporter ATP-binding protein [Caldisericia bacterium]|nr:ABC transporter ATP-binding protein [Caldisericia bacterium]